MNFLLSKITDVIDENGMIVLFNYNKNLTTELIKRIKKIYSDIHIKIIESDDINLLNCKFKECDEYECVIFVTTNIDFLHNNNLKHCLIEIFDDIFYCDFKLNYKLESKSNIQLSTEFINKNLIDFICDKLIESSSKNKENYSISLSNNDIKILKFFLNKITKPVNTDHLKDTSDLENIDIENSINQLNRLFNFKLYNISFNKLTTFENVYRVYFCNVTKLLAYLNINNKNDLTKLPFFNRLILSIITVNIMLRNNNNLLDFEYEF